MVDRQTNSVWTHLDGEAIDGTMQGSKMEIVFLVHTTWKEWQRLHPDTLVLSDDTPFRSRYREVKIGQPNGRASQALLYGDDRLKAEELVLGVRAGDTYAAYPLVELNETNGVVEDILGDTPIVVFYDAVAVSAIAFSSLVEGRRALFENVGDGTFLARDSITGTTWDFTGQGVAGTLKGASLKFVASYLSEWYGWSAYHPSTSVYESAH